MLAFSQASGVVLRLLFLMNTLVISAVFFIFDFLSSLPFARNASMRGVVKIDPKIFKNCRDLSTAQIFLSPTVSKRACSKFDQQSNTETVQYNFFQYLSSFSDA